MQRAKSWRIFSPIPPKSMADISKGAGKNHSYIQKFMRLGTPRKLPEDVRRSVAEQTGIDESLLGADDSIVNYDMNKFRKTLSELIERDNTNMKQLSQAVKGKPNLIRDFISEKTSSLRLETASRIAEYFNVSLDSMMAGELKNIPISLDKRLLIKELDVQAQGGGGMVVAEETIIGEWEMPREFLRQFVRTDTSNIVIISVVGDSMMPDYMPGQRVMVNTADTHPVPEGVFVVFIDGLMIKRCQVVPRSEPPMIKIISANDSYDTYEVELQDGMIKGRVVGSWNFS